MDYMGIIKRGWSHTWNNKFLWALGFLAALGSGGAYSNSGRYTFNSDDASAMSAWMTPERAAALTGGIIAFACIGFIVGIILWLVSLSARGGLIRAVADLELGTGKPTFGEAFRAGWKHVGRLVGMTILLYIVPTILILVLVVGFITVIGGAAVMGSNMDDPSGLMAGIGGLSLVFLCLLCLLIPFMIILEFIYPFAFRGIVLRGMGARESLRHGWAVLKENLGEIIILGLGFFFIGLVVALVALAILAPVALIAGVPFMALMRSDATALQGILVALGLLVTVVVSALISAITTSWQSSTFTLAYLEWTGKNIALD